MSQFGFNLSFQLPGQVGLNFGYSNTNRNSYGSQQALYPGSGIQDTLGSINSFLGTISGIDSSIGGNPYGLDFYGNNYQTSNYNSPSQMAGLYGNSGAQAFASAGPNGAQAFASAGNQGFMPQQTGMQNQNPFMNMMNMMMQFMQMMMQMIMQMFGMQNQNQGYNQGYNQGNNGINYSSPSAMAGLYGNNAYAGATAGPNGASAYAGTNNGYSSASSRPATNAPMYTPQGSSASGRSIASSAERTANSMGSTGWCYRGVKRALAQNGVNLTGGSAYQAADQLARNSKFQEVQVPRNQLRSLPAGAVVVWDKCPGHKHGHISVALGDGREASDHIQRQMTNYGPRFRVFLPN